MAFSSGSSSIFGGASNNQSSVFGAPKPAGNSIFGASQPAQQQATAGLFGQPAQPQQATGGLFGQSNQQQPQQTTGGLFGQPTQQQQPQQTTGGLFGQTTQQQPQQPAGGLFGQSAQQQPQQSTGGLFGQPTQQSTQQSSGGLFGQSAQQPATNIFGQSQGQQQQQQPTGGLFGQPTTQTTTNGPFAQSTTQPAGGLFGQSTAQPAGAGLFGQSSGVNQFGQSTTQPSGGLFGQSAQPQQQGTSLFGSLNPQQQNQQQANPGLFGNSLQTQSTTSAGGLGGSLFGNNQQQSQQQSFGAYNANASQVALVPLFLKSTKFNDLPEEIKRTLESIDAHIQGRAQVSKDLHQRKLGDEALKAQELLRDSHRELVKTSTQTRNDLSSTKDMKIKVEQAVQDTIVATRIVDGFKAPQGSGAGYLKDHASFPLEFFMRATENMKRRLSWYRATIEQIERKLSLSAGQSMTPQAVSATLQAQHMTFLAFASKTAALDADLQKIKALYVQLWRAKTGSVRDPFNELDNGIDGDDHGIQSLGVK